MSEDGHLGWDRDPAGDQPHGAGAADHTDAAQPGGGGRREVSDMSCDGKQL